MTGTFGGVDFFHSVMGELSDKTTQSEIQELEGSVAQRQRSANKSMVYVHLVIDPCLEMDSRGIVLAQTLISNLVKSS